MFKVVVHEGLHQHLIHVQACRWSRDREQVLHERSKQSMTLNSKYDDSRSEAYLLCPENLLRGRKERNYWSGAPNHRAGFGW